MCCAFSTLRNLFTISLYSISLYSITLTLISFPSYFFDRNFFFPYFCHAYFFVIYLDLRSLIQSYSQQNLQVICFCFWEMVGCLDPNSCVDYRCFCCFHVPRLMCFAVNSLHSRCLSQTLLKVLHCIMSCYIWIVHLCVLRHVLIFLSVHSFSILNILSLGTPLIYYTLSVSFSWDLWMSSPISLYSLAFLSCSDFHALNLELACLGLRTCSAIFWADRHPRRFCVVNHNLQSFWLVYIAVFTHC